uniref:Uncharacterized protein n=1 Tax=Anguilla anguilla TaxID=7936 RepID=A0A0E9QYJ7_ANGAN
MAAQMTFGCFFNVQLWTCILGIKNIIKT